MKFEQRGDVAPIPITVTLTYANGETESVVVPVTERVVERTLKLKGALRKVEANEDNAALAEIEKTGVVEGLGLGSGLKQDHRVSSRRFCLSLEP